MVVLLPDSKIAAYTLRPSLLTARARGSSARIGTTVGAFARLAVSNTSTWLACEQLTNARVPANTTS